MLAARVGRGVEVELQDDCAVRQFLIDVGCDEATASFVAARIAVVNAIKDRLAATSMPAEDLAILAGIPQADLRAFLLGRNLREFPQEQVERLLGAIS